MPSPVLPPSSADNRLTKMMTLTTPTLMKEAFGLMGQALALLYLGLALLLLLGQLSPPKVLLAQGAVLPVAAFFVLMTAWLQVLVTLLQVPVYRLTLRWFAFHPSRSMPSPPWPQRCLALLGLQEKAEEKAIAKKNKTTPPTKQATKQEGEEKPAHPVVSSPAVALPKENVLPESVLPSFDPKAAEALQESLVKEGAQPLRLFSYLLPGLGQLFLPLALGQLVQAVVIASIWAGLAYAAWAYVLHQPSIGLVKSWAQLPWVSLLTTGTPQQVLLNVQAATQGVLSPSVLQQLMALGMVGFLSIALFQGLTVLWLPYVVVWRFNVVQAYRLAIGHWKLDAKGISGLLLWLGAGFLGVEALTLLADASVWEVLLEMLWFLFSSLVLCMYVVSQTGSPDLKPLALETLHLQALMQPLEGVEGEKPLDSFERTLEQTSQQTTSSQSSVTTPKD